MGAAGRMRRSRPASPAEPAAKPPPSSSVSRRDDHQRVLEHVHEDERENSHREHRQRDAGPVRERCKPPERQAQIDGEAGERSERDGLAE
jgi:hypothetical protein